MSHEFPFEGIRVLDASQGIAGPSAAMLLAQYGAEVIKVEPQAGDWSRTLGSGKNGMTSLAVATNLGKRSIALDLKKPEGAEILRRLMQRADVFVESFRTGVMERLGFSYSQVASYNPQVVYLSVTGFGQQGPMRDQPATDAVLQAFSGMMGMNTGREDELPHRIDCWPIDVITGWVAFQAIAMALYARRDSGRGRYIDTSLLHGATALQSVRIAEHAASGGAQTVASAFPFGTFRTRDGWINLTVLRDGLWPAFCRIVGRPDWESDPELASVAGRRARAAEIMASTNAVFAQQTSEHWCTLLRAADILNERVNTYDEMLAHRQTQETDLFTWLEHPSIGTVPHPNLPGPQPVQRGATRGTVPQIGAHTREVLGELGYIREEIERLIEQRMAFT